MKIRIINKTSETVERTLVILIRTIISNHKSKYQTIKYFIWIKNVHFCKVYKFHWLSTPTRLYMQDIKHKPDGNHKKFCSKYTQKFKCTESIALKISNVIGGEESNNYESQIELENNELKRTYL